MQERVLRPWRKAKRKTKGTKTVPPAPARSLWSAKEKKQREKLSSAQESNLSVLSLWEFLPYPLLVSIAEGKAQSPATVLENAGAKVKLL